jgi:hypothetical protein
MSNQETQGGYRSGMNVGGPQAASGHAPGDPHARRPGIHVPNPATPCRSGEYNPGGTAWANEPPTEPW